MFVVLEAEVSECLEQSSRDAKGKNAESDLLVTHANNKEIVPESSVYVVAKQTRF